MRGWWSTGDRGVFMSDEPFDGVEYHGELFVIPSFERVDLPGEVSVRLHQAAQLNERPHDRDVDLDCPRRAEYARQHRHPQFSKGVGQVLQVAPSL